MSVSYQVFTNVSAVTLAGSSLGGVQKISLVKSRAELRASGDGELYDSVASAGACGASGTIRTSDAVAAAALDGKTGVLSFAWSAGGGGADRTVTVQSASVTGVEVDASERGASGAIVRFVAAASDGVTDPVAIT